MPKTVQMMALILSLLSVFSVFFCEYLQVQYTVNWCLILWISLLILSDLQGWLTVISAPYRPRPDSVAMDGRQWLPWLHSLCQFTRRMDSFTQREACVCACVCECVWMHMSVCSYVLRSNRAIHPWRECNKLREEPAHQMVRANGKGRWGEVQRNWGILYQLTEDTVSWNCQPSTLWQVFVHRVFEM